MAEEELPLEPIPFKDMKVGKCYIIYYISMNSERYMGRLVKKRRLENNDGKYELEFLRSDRMPTINKSFEYKRNLYTHYTKLGREEYYEVPCMPRNDPIYRRRHALKAWARRREGVRPVPFRSSPTRRSRSRSSSKTRRSSKSRSPSGAK